MPERIAGILCIIFYPEINGQSHALSLHYFLWEQEEKVDHKQK